MGSHATKIVQQQSSFQRAHAEMQTPPKPAPDRADEAPTNQRRFQLAHASLLIRLWDWRRQLDRREYVTLIEILSRFCARELSRQQNVRRIG